MENTLMAEPITLLALLVIVGLNRNMGYRIKLEWIKKNEI